jgi:DNA-binding MarR family transcriptional regulator
MTGPGNENHIDRILHLGEELFRRLLPTVPKELLDLDLTMAQMKTVLVLFLHGPTRVSDLAAALGVTLATTTRVVDRLTERDFVLRETHPEDRRVVLCCLSENGQELIAAMWQSARSRTRQLLEMAEPSKLQGVVEALEALSDVASHVERGASLKEME